MNKMDKRANVRESFNGVGEQNFYEMMTTVSYYVATIELLRILKHCATF